MSDLKALAQGMFDGLSGGSDIDAAVDRYMADDFVEHEPVPVEGTGKDIPRQLFKMMHAAFPDFHVDVHEML